jgi:hypothetical protein
MPKKQSTSQKETLLPTKSVITIHPPKVGMAAAAQQSSNKLQPPCARGRLGAQGG